MADKYEEFQKMGVEVYSVSTDTHFTHKAWHDTSDTIKKIHDWHGELKIKMVCRSLRTII